MNPGEQADAHIRKFAAIFGPHGAPICEVPGTACAAPPPPPRLPMRCVWHADETAHGRPRVSRSRASNRTGEGRPDARPRRLEGGAVERCSCGECACRFADGPDFEGPPYAEDAVPPAPRGAAGNTAAGEGATATLDEKGSGRQACRAKSGVQAPEAGAGVFHAPGGDGRQRGRRR